MTSSAYTSVALDIHYYTFFDSTKIAFTNAQRVAYYCSLRSGLARHVAVRSSSQLLLILLLAGPRRI